MKPGELLLTVTVVLSICLTAGNSVQAADYRCDINGDRRLGLAEAISMMQDLAGLFAEPSGTVVECGPPDYEIVASGTLSADAQRYLLCRMNRIRSQTALGQTEDDGTDDYYPIANNMYRMRWDKDLATVASDYAALCTFSHNPYRDEQYAALSGISNPAVGENIAAYGTTQTIGSAVAVSAVESAFVGWNNESVLWHYDTINSTSWAQGIGHFTQNVWATSTRVGCGQAWCPNGYPGNPNFNMVLTVCNFYPAGNYWGQYPYQTGNDVCSSITNPSDTCQNGLITPFEYDTGIAYECDVNNDERLGLHEVINTLLILSGY